MTVRIGEMISELRPGRAPARGPRRDSGTNPWDELERARILEAEVERDRERTRARDFDD